MIIFPAIDIKDGRPVRLTKGEFSTVEQVAKSAEYAAETFKHAGATHLHMVDLDGALKKERTNFDVIIGAAKIFGGFTQIGGGIHDMETVEFYLRGGIDRVILGSAALKNPKFMEEAISEYGAAISIGIDAKNRMVSVSGWTDTTDIDFIEFSKRCEASGASNIIFTDIGRDGTLEGANIELLAELKNALSAAVITASGGVRDIEDIRALRNLGMYGAICGKSIYMGTLNLEKAIEEAK